MNNFSQSNIFDYSKVNSKFIKHAMLKPETIDWGMAISQLLRYSNCSACSLSRHLEVKRDHIQALKIGKVKKPRPNIKDKLIRLTVFYVPESGLTYAIKGGGF